MAGHCFTLCFSRLPFQASGDNRIIAGCHWGLLAANDNFACFGMTAEEGIDGSKALGLCQAGGCSVWPNLPGGATRVRRGPIVAVEQNGYVA